MTITLRTTKGLALTHAELDGNFSDLDARATSASAAVSSLDTRLDAVEPIAAGAVQSAGLSAELAALNVVTATTNPVTGGIINTIWNGTQAQYDAIAVKDDATLYVIV